MARAIAHARSAGGSEGNAISQLFRDMAITYQHVDKINPLASDGGVVLVLPLLGTIGSLEVWRALPEGIADLRLCRKHG